MIEVKRYGPEGPGKAGDFMLGTIELAGEEFMLLDSAVKHGFGFTPSVSLFVTCESADEIKALAGKLGEGATLLMPLDKYPFAEKFVWLNDRYGVSWQLTFNPA